MCICFYGSSLSQRLGSVFEKKVHRTKAPSGLMCLREWVRPKLVCCFPFFHSALLSAFSLNLYHAYFRYTVKFCLSKISFEFTHFFPWSCFCCYWFVWLVDVIAEDRWLSSPVRREQLAHSWIIHLSSVYGARPWLCKASKDRWVTALRTQWGCPLKSRQL